MGRESEECRKRGTRALQGVIEGPRGEREEREVKI